MGKSIEVTTTGKAAHGAMPYLGLNAIIPRFEENKDWKTYFLSKK